VAVCVLVVTAGPDSDWKITEAAVAVIVSVAIFAGVCCCSWLEVAMLERCMFGGGNSLDPPP
jgi:hypothetical protein